MVIGIDASRANLRERTGTERYAYEIIRELIRLDRTDRFVLYLDDEPLSDLQNLGPNVEYRILRWPPKFLWSQLRLAWELLWRRPDVLFVPAHTIPVIHPPRTIVTIHDIGFERLPELYGRQPIGGSGAVGVVLNALTRLITLGRYSASELDYHRWSARFAVRHARHIITVSAFSRQEMLEVYRARPDRISVIPHGLNTTTFRRPPPQVIEAAQQRHGLAAPYLLYTGRLERKKNILALIKIFAATKKLLPSLELALIGRPGLGWHEAAGYITANQLDSSVHSLGWQPDAIYRDLLAGATAFIMVSRYEGFGMPVLESFAVGTPVIVANAASLPEIVGAAGTIIDPDHIDQAASTIAKVLSDKAERNRLIALGTDRVHEYTWTKAARLTLEKLQA